MMRPLVAVVALALSWAAAAPALGQQPAPPRTGDAAFTVFVGGTRVGAMRSSLVRTGAGWTITGDSDVSGPAAVTIRRIEINYTADWRPRGLTMDATTAAESVVVHGGFTDGVDDRVEIVNEQRQVVFVTPAVSRDALILPNIAYSAYEALAAWLADAAPAAERRVYIVPHREITIRLDEQRRDNVTVDGRKVAVQRCRVSFLEAGAAVVADVWVFEGRLVRFDVPSRALSIRRDDAADR